MKGLEKPSLLSIYFLVTRLFDICESDSANVKTSKQSRIIDISLHGNR